MAKKRSETRNLIEEIWATGQGDKPPVEKDSEMLGAVRGVGIFMIGIVAINIGVASLELVTEGERPYFATEEPLQAISLSSGLECPVTPQLRPMTFVRGL